MSATVIPMPTAAAAAPTAAAPTFEFGPEFETKLCALLLRDERFAKEAAVFLQSEHFTSVVERNLASTIIGFTQTYRTVPSETSLVDVLMREKRVPAAEMPIYITKIIELRAADLREREFLRKRVVDFCKKQAFLLAAIRIPDLVAKGKFDDAAALTNKAKNIGQASAAEFYEFFEQAEARKKVRDAEAAGIIKRGVPTGFPELDKVLFQKGWGRGEITVIMAPSKRGKTALMMQSAFTSAVQHGTTALYITLEVSTEILSGRGDACLTSTEMDDLIGRREDIERMIAALRTAPSIGKIYIERRPANTMTTDAVDALLQEYEDAGIKIEVCVVDYLGIMRLVPADDRFIGLGNATKELRRIADQRGIAMITGAQTNRDALAMQVAGQGSIGESYQIIQDCDLALSINADDAEMAKGVRRIHIAAGRNQREATIKVQGDLAKMQIVQNVLEVT